jgi:hypothetical protein
MCAGIVGVRPQLAHRCVFDFHFLPFRTKSMPRNIGENRTNKNSDNSDAERFCQTYCRTFLKSPLVLELPEISGPAWRPPHIIILENSFAPDAAEGASDF